MFASRVSASRRGRDEPEKPFWISFADLMTASMVMFLVVMAVALLAVTKRVSEQERRQIQYREDVQALLARFAQAASDYEGIRVDKDRYVIDFGDRARFAFASSSLSSVQQAALRQFVPEILKIANSDLGVRVLKRFVVEGYTDKTGSYLSNLNLSLQRSQRVLCTMFATSGQNLLDEAQKIEVRDLFLVGGYSFNSAKASDEASRRVEMRLEFLGLDEKRPAVHDVTGNFGECALR
jgi:outer membrane protein OmpA-like peptidoglycan-associated protein